MSDRRASNRVGHPTATDRARLDGVRGVLFDAGNTLLWLDHARMAEIVTGAGAPRSAEQLRVAEIRARPRLDPLVGRAPKRESPHVRRRYVELIVEGLDLAGDDASAVDAALSAAWDELWTAPPDDAHDTLTSLRAAGYRLGCVSNSDGQVARRLSDAGLLGLLDSVTDSGDVGIEKPDPRIFTIGAERLGLPPAAIAYVGDLYSVDVLGARAAGLLPLIIDPLDVWDVDCLRLRALAELLSLLPPSSSTRR